MDKQRYKPEGEKNTQKLDFGVNFSFNDTSVPTIRESASTLKKKQSLFTFCHSHFPAGTVSFLMTRDRTQ